MVFEHVDHTILEDLDRNPHGLSDDKDTGVVRKCMWQLLKAMDYLHSYNVPHFNFLTFDRSFTEISNQKYDLLEFIIRIFSCPTMEL